MPRIDNPNERGYLVVKFEVHCPDTFTLEQKDKMYEVLALSQTQVEADVVECPAGVDIIAYRARFKELCEQMKNDPEYWMHVYR